MLRLWKFCQTKEVIIFFCDSCLETVLSSLFPLCTLWANQISLVLGEEETAPWFKAFLLMAYPWADFPRKRAGEFNPTSAGGTLACSPFTCGASAAATQGRALRKEQFPEDTGLWGGGIRGFEGNGNFWGQGPVIWEVFWAGEVGGRV